MINHHHLKTPFTVHLVGPALQEHRISIDQFSLFTTQIQVAVKRIGLILAGRSGSLVPGRKPRAITQSCSLDIVQLKPGSLSIVFDLQKRKHEQLELFPEENLGEDSLNSLVSGINQLATSNGDMPRGFDKGVLLSLREAGKVLSQGVEKIEFELESQSQNGKKLRARYGQAEHNNVITRIQAPITNKCSIEGILLMGDFNAAGYNCRIHPLSGRAVKCTFGDEQREAILAGLTHKVRVVGEALHEPQNEIRLLKIEDIEIIDSEGQATALLDESFFEYQINLDAIAQEQGVPDEQSFESLLGTFWPEDESADDFIAAVRELSDAA